MHVDTLHPAPANLISVYSNLTEEDEAGEYQSGRDGWERRLSFTSLVITDDRDDEAAVSGNIVWSPELHNDMMQVSAIIVHVWKGKYNRSESYWMYLDYLNDVKLRKK